jgi:hypothetical protein
VGKPPTWPGGSPGTASQNLSRALIKVKAGAMARSAMLGVSDKTNLVFLRKQSIKTLKYLVDPQMAFPSPSSTVGAQ